MISSMTGFGRAQQVVEGREITVEVKSVNHRFFEFAARTPRAYGYLEEKLKGFFQQAVSRGKMEAAVTIQTLEGPSARVLVNQELAGAYVEGLRRTGQALGLQDDLTLSALARFGDIFTLQRQEEDEDAVWQAVQGVAAQALEKFLAMRRAEGARLEADLLAKLESILGHVAFVEEQSPKTVAAYRQRLEAKLREVLADRQLDEARVIAEAAIFADRVAVDEETVRLRSHIAQFREILAGPAPVGRKLDFLVQEMNREANTIGSKAQDTLVARRVVEIKSDIEKIREQIQNIE
ncbi:MAG TPA: YicC family protein [Candidatus Anaerotruncus excrementipullorum]|uniref:YicC family protein n=1 Tax=Candidatus Anaerotruncus excrementipullorum TaxID=2838465 RepID=A0A9D1WRU9_9FIRM|nr:YicC family protein [Candidatus Anaerotruncus excrementipullorum]